MNWIKDFIPTIKRNISQTFGEEKDSKIPEGLWRSCDSCGSILYIPELKKNSYVCSKCSHHFKINVKERIEVTFDKGSYKDLNKTEAFKDYLKFKDTKKYKDRFQDAQNKTECDEALSIGVGTIKGKKVVSAMFEFDFLGGSMGAIVGKRFAAAVDYAVENSHPLIVFSTSGGARMQESMISLFQMGKTAAAVKKLKNENLPYISVLVDPCYGGVTASLAMLGDLILAEPKARIGFSGKRVIQDTVKEDLPKDFQTAETQLENGFVDKIKANIEDVKGIVYCVGSIDLKPLKMASESDFNKCMKLNLYSAIDLIKGYQDSLKKNNGSIVLFSTVAAQRGFTNHSIIASTKAAVEGLTVSLAAEFAPKYKSKLCGFKSNKFKNCTTTIKKHCSCTRYSKSSSIKKNRGRKRWSSSCKISSYR